MPFRSQAAKRATRALAAMSSPSYESWTREELIARLKLLDSKLPQASDLQTKRAALPHKQKTKPPKAFNIASYPRRKIALKFCYTGIEYNGLAFQNDKTPLPTVEGTLYDAMASCKLIDGAAGPEGCGWERCGRTDRGVSSAGQVVSLWVRSNIGQPAHDLQPCPSTPEYQTIENIDETKTSDIQSNLETDLQQLNVSDLSNVSIPAPEVDSQKQELRYLTILNRVLPPTIRILAWSPVSADFSSRFNCTQRHYKYFFSPEGLNLTAMRDAAARLVGEHDFRNLCKIDPSKQITSFRRKILRADISSTSVLVNDDTVGVGEDPGHMCVFDLMGTAFLYNQVRHIMAVIFLVGAGLEPPSVMTALLNADSAFPERPSDENEPPPETVTCKPEYQMADPLPLVLWECSYGPGDVSWVTDNPEREDNTDAKSLYRQLHAAHARRLVNSVLDVHFLKAASTFHPPPPHAFPLDAASHQAFLQNNPSTVLSIPLGGGSVRRIAARSYTPLLRRKRLEHVDVVNERWRKGKGERKSAKRAEVVLTED